MIDWQWLTFEAMTKDQLYQMLRIRQEVFAVEQNCVYLDVDGLDQNAWHLLARHKSDNSADKILGYLRVIYPGIKYMEPAIGRVLTIEQARGTGLGKQLMETALMYIEKEYPNQAVRLSAQQYLLRFYAGFGFQSVSEPYDEDGIPHVEMLRPGKRL
ncbi:MAG: GNAT family N-acetyltransferase [Pseudomonadales bacterium]